MVESTDAIDTAQFFSFPKRGGFQLISYGIATGLRNASNDHQKGHFTRSGKMCVRHEVDLCKLIGLMTDWAPAMCGDRNRLVHYKKGDTFW